MYKRFGWAFVVLTVFVCLSGCGSKKTAAKPEVGLVTDAGGIDDQSFNASAWAGLQKATAETGIQTRYVESKEQADYKTNLTALAEQGNKLIFAVGYMMQDALKEVAPNYPNVKFAIIDGDAPKLPNCVALKFREEQGSFLAGYLAGRMSKTGTLGFVGGVEGPLIKKFEVGYIAGARTANPKVKVIVKYIGGWTDVAKGKELALSAFREGADIVFHATGKAGLGVLDAANEMGPGYYGIGVDADQDSKHPGRVLTSMMKGVDTAVYETVKAYKSGKWKSGELVFGIKEGGVHLSPMKYTKQDVPADVLAKLDEISKRIADGKIIPPTTQDELNAFKIPTL